MRGSLIITIISGTKRVRLVNGELQIFETPNDTEVNELQLIVSVPLTSDQATTLAQELISFAKPNLPAP